MKKILGLTVCCALSFLSYSQSLRHPVYEPPINQNLANKNSALLHRCKEITSSPVWDKCNPNLAVDGIISNNSYWAAENIPVWYNLELKQIEPISTITVYPYYGDNRFYRYKVEGSVDGKTWQLLGDKTQNTTPANAQGDTFNFQETQLKFIKVTFLHNSAGNQFGGHLLEITANSSKLPTSGLFQVEETQRFNRHTYPESITKTQHAWRGERCNWQLYFYTDKQVQHLSFVPNSLVLKSKQNQTLPLNAFFPRYVLAKNQPYADILDRELPIAIPAQTGRPLWISADIPQDINPGLYQGTVQVNADGVIYTCPISLQVARHVLPPPSQWQLHLDIWQHPEPFARWHDVPLWSDEHFALMRPAMERLAQTGQKNITCTLIHEAWNAQTYDWFSGMITWIKKKDGSWSYDYTIFDKWVEFMHSCGITQQISCYTMIPWHLSFRYFDESQNKWIDKKMNPGTEEYENFWKNFLLDFKQHLTAKNWLQKTAIAMDERPDHLLRPAIAILKKYAPELRIVSAVDRPSDLSDSCYDISIVYSHCKKEQRLLDKRKALGLKTTAYVCLHPARPNTFTSSALVESYWLPISIASMNYDGFLRWAYNSWNKNPFESTDFVAWPSGDCFLVYPGNRSSLRFETLRDGLEDFEKITLLRQQKFGKIQQLEELLKNSFGPEKCNETPQQMKQNVDKLKTIINN